MKYLHNTIFTLTIGILFLGCEEQVDWTFQPLENGVLVVEAVITNELGRQEVWLSRSYDDLNGEPAPVVDAEVRVFGGGETFVFGADGDRPGRYAGEQFFAARMGTTYTLEILWRGASYVARNEMVAVRPFNRLTFQPVGAGRDTLRLAEPAPLYSPDEQAMYEIDIDWSHLAGTDSARAKQFFYTFSTVDINELFRPPQETVAFPRGSVVRGRKYSLNPAFAAYQRALLSETEWQGGVFDEASASLPTNISNGALGFFAVCAVLTQTVAAE